MTIIHPQIFTDNALHGFTLEGLIPDLLIIENGASPAPTFIKL